MSEYNEVMLTVADILTISGLSDATLMAGVPAKERTVRGIAILDHEPLTNSYESYRPGEIAFTSLAFAQGDAAFANEGLQKLLDQGLSAIFVQDKFGITPSDAVQARAREQKAAIYYFDKGYMEDVIADAKNLLKNSENEAEIERRLDAFRHVHDNEQRSKQFCDIIGMTTQQIQAFALAAHKEDALSIAAMKTAVGQFLAQSPLRHFATPYHGCLLVFIAEPINTVFGTCPYDDCALAKELQKVLGPHCGCGYSDPLPSYEANWAIEQSYSALMKARNQKIDKPIHWSKDIDLAFSAAAQESPLFHQEAAYQLARLNEADSTGDLVECLRCYIDQDGNIATAANLLHIHPNSLRNRLRKTKEVLGIEDRSDYALFSYLHMLFLGL